MPTFVRMCVFLVVYQPACAKRLIKVRVGRKSPKFDNISITNRGLKYDSKENFPKEWKREFDESEDKDCWCEVNCGRTSTLLCESLCA